MTVVVLHQARYDLRAFLRNRQARTFTLLLPLLLLVVFSSLNARPAAFYVPGLAALAVVAASFVNLVISLTAQREAGVLKRRRSTPISASALIAARSLVAGAVSLASVAAVVATGGLAFGVPLDASALPGVVLTALAGSVTFTVLAYALSAQIRSADAAQPMVQALTVPLYLISGVFIPDSQLPGSVQRLAGLLPVERLADGLRHACESGGVAWDDLLVLAAWAGAGLVLALRRFAWTPLSTTT
jgi:ABC-2 type transport system permease protein